MPSFSYRALGRDGKEVRGVLQAESETAAVTRIRDNYPVLLSIRVLSELWVLCLKQVLKNTCFFFMQ